ncbi:hypothetical protein ACLKA7_004919 [Drosophila subpalustris]
MVIRNCQPDSDRHCQHQQQQQHQHHQHRSRPSTLAILLLLSRLCTSIRNTSCIRASTNITIGRILIRRRRICTLSPTRNNAIIARIGIIYRIS